MPALLLRNGVSSIAPLLVVPLITHVARQAIEIAVQLGGFAAVEAAIGAKRAFLGFDVTELAIKPARFAVGQRPVMQSTLDSFPDTCFALVDRRGPFVRSVVAYCTASTPEW